MKTIQINTLEMIANLNQQLANADRKIAEYKKAGETLAKLVIEQSKIINDCMREIPVGNVTTHKPENLSERIGFFVEKYSKYAEAEERLCDILGLDIDIDQVEKTIECLQNDYCIYKETLEMIRDGTEYAQDLANKALDWKDVEKLDQKELCEDNLMLKLELATLWKDYRRLEEAYNEK